MNDSRKLIELHLAEYRRQTAALTDDFAGMVDIKHGELKDIVLKHAETVKRDALFVSNRLVDANDVAKSIQKNLQAAAAEWNQSQDALARERQRFEKVCQKLDDAIKAYEAGQCDTFTSDVSQLYALRLRLAKTRDHDILPDVISKEPLAPVVRQRDDDWMMIVKWTLYAMINAEELGITSKNIDEALKSKKPDVMRLVGT